MANWECATRTNYFHVKNEEGFRALMNTVYSNEGKINLWENKDQNGHTVFGFGAYSQILGIPREIDAEFGDIEFDDDSEDKFIAELQKFIADDDAIIIFETGNEKLRTVNGYATIITSQNYDYVDLKTVAIKRAAKMLSNPDWTTTCEY